MSAVCTKAEPLGNRESAHGKLIGVEFLTPPELGRGCPSIQTSHLTMYYRGFKSRETEKRDRNRGLLVEHKRALRALQRKCLGFRDSAG